MPEFRSALLTALKPGRYGAGTGAAPLTLSERPPGALAQIAGWPGGRFAPAAGHALAAVGLDGLGDYRSAREAGGVAAYRLGPERLLLRASGSEALERVRRAVDPAAACWTELSHARTVIRLAGPASAALLARILAIDLQPAAFGPGAFAQTGAHGAPMLLHRRADAGGAPVFELQIPYTWAETVWEDLIESALPFGVQVA